MRFARVAVQCGATVRVAGAEATGPPRVLAESPASGARGVAELLDGVLGVPPDELVLVHPVGWPAERVAAAGRRCAGPAHRVRPVAAPVAVGGGAREYAVLDVGHTGSEATLVRDGAVAAHRCCAVGGDRLDDVVLALLGQGWAEPEWPDPETAERGWVEPPGSGSGGAGPGSTAAGLAVARREARGLREMLSLQPSAVVGTEGAAGVVRLGAAEVRGALKHPLGAAVAVLREVLDAAGGAVPVLLVGGVARTPLLTELVDDAGIAGAVVAPRPEAAAVLGALTLRWPPDGPACGPPAAPVGVRSVPGGRWLPPLPPPRLGRPVLASVAAAGAAAVLLAAGYLLTPAAARLPMAVQVPAGVLVQYGYRLDLPSGWEHTGGLPERRRVLLTPAAAPQGNDLIAVERTPLGYDTSAEPDRARAELRAEFDAAVAGGSPLSGYDPTARVAGRHVTAYLQHDGPTTVEWFVVLDGDAQLSVGCRHTPTGVEPVRAACAAVVASVRRT